MRSTASIDLNNTGGFAHYGAPVITHPNTIFVPVKTGSTGGFQISVFLDILRETKANLPGYWGLQGSENQQPLSLRKQRNSELLMCLNETKQVFFTSKGGTH